MDRFVARVVLGVNERMMSIAGLDGDLHMRMVLGPLHQLAIAEIFSHGTRRATDLAVVQCQLLQLKDASGGHGFVVVGAFVCLFKQRRFERVTYFKRAQGHQGVPVHPLGNREQCPWWWGNACTVMSSSPDPPAPTKKGQRTSRSKKSKEPSSDDGTVSSKQSQKSSAIFDAFDTASGGSGDPFFGDMTNAFDNSQTAASSLFSPERNTATAFEDFGSEGFFDSAFDTGAGTFNGGRNSSNTPLPDETVWDTDPHETVPSLPASQPWKIQLKRSIRKQPVVEPIHNPKTGHVVFVHQLPEPNASYWLSQVDTETNQQVIGFPILDQALRDRVKAKYNANILYIHKVWRIAAGGSTGNVAALFDAKAIESSTTMRLIVGWDELGVLQYVLTPPSGGDFVYNIQNFAIANASIFLAGGSPKGSCIFVSRPAIRESWSANFLTGSGQITAMAVAPHGRPWVVVGLTDQSITVWAYKPSTNSKRWLLPLCRLDVTEQLQTVPASPLPGVEGDADSGGA
jgi:hypothetical protein